MEGISFDNIESQEDRKGYTPAGVIDVFRINKVEYTKQENGKQYLEYFFERKDDQFSQRFYLTTEATLKRFKNFYEKVTGEPITNDEKVIIAKSQGKKIALKVTGAVTDKGLAIGNLPFFDFCKKPEDIGQLQMSNNDLKEIAEYEAAKANMAKADTQASAPAAAEATADDF